MVCIWAVLIIDHWYIVYNKYSISYCIIVSIPRSFMKTMTLAANVWMKSIISEGRCGRCTSKKSSIRFGQSPTKSNVNAIPTIDIDFGFLSLRTLLLGWFFVFIIGQSIPALNKQSPLRQHSNKHTKKRWRSWHTCLALFSRFDEFRLQYEVLVVVSHPIMCIFVKLYKCTRMRMPTDYNYLSTRFGSNMQWWFSRVARNSIIWMYRWE